MLIKYPYIILGLIPVFAPIILIFGVIGGMTLVVVPMMNDSLSETKFTSAYDFMLNSTGTTLFVYPQFTYFANEENSLADIGTENCNGCEKYIIFTEEITDNSGRICDKCKRYTINFWDVTVTSGAGLPYLTGKDSLALGGVSDTGESVYMIGFRYFNVTNDNSINIKPEILQEFDRIILMRNVYVTENLRQAILKHDNVIYMFPDAMTKQVNIQNMTDAVQIDDKIVYANTTMTYVGEYEPLHPMVPVWADDNRCNDWHFVPVQNGYMMNCTPDVAIINNHDMLVAMRDIGTISRP